MISAKQIKQILDISFTGGSGFLAPTSTFIITPSNYSTDDVPGAVNLTGVITPNDGTDITWTITSGVTTLAIGTGNVVAHSLASVPSTVTTNTYNLNVSYKNSSGTTMAVIFVASLSVTAPALIGQLDGPTENIIVAGDLTPTIEGYLTTTDQITLINLFNIVAADSGRIIFVLPDSYGVVSSIEDGAGLNIITQFNVVVDTINNRKIYTSINVVTPATYSYKISF